MALMRPDPTFYPLPEWPCKRHPERLAYVALINPKQRDRPDAIGFWTLTLIQKVMGVWLARLTCARPATSCITDELHHFGWNACSSRTHRIRTWSGAICGAGNQLVAYSLTLKQTHASRSW